MTPDQTAARHVRPTLRTIADLTGFAVTTVSRALSNAPQISAETRRRVHEVAAEIGYLPDRAAQRLKTGRTNVISVLLDPHEEILGYGTSLMLGLAKALTDTPYHIIVTPNFMNDSNLDAVRHIVRNSMADGLIFSRTEPFDPRVRFLLENDFPFVCHGRTELSTPHPYVDYDNFSFAYHAARRLVSKGRKKLTIVLPPPRFTFGRHLRDGFMTAIGETGVAFEICEAVTLDNTADEIRQATSDRRLQPDAPDGYICSGDAAALSVMAGLTDIGVTIGNEADVVAKQTSGIFSQIRPKVDAIYEDTALAGKQMGELLLRRIQGEPAETLQILHQPEIWF